MRTRLIHPEFFSSATLARLPIEARFLFAGLWCMADREGLVLDLPKQIAGEVFPHEPHRDGRQVGKWLDLLASGDSPCIERFDAGGKKIIRIINFLSFQRPHQNEKKSVLAHLWQHNVLPKATQPQHIVDPIAVSVSVPVTVSVSASDSGNSETVPARSPQPTGFSTPANITPETTKAEPTSRQRARKPVPDLSDPADIPRLVAIQHALLRFCRACPAPVCTWDEPDWGLCHQLLTIAKGGDSGVAWINGFLADLERGGRKPTTSYGWFVTLAREAMAGGTVYVGGGRLALMPPSPAPAESDERKSEAM